MNRFRVLSAAIVLLISIIFGIISYVAVLNKPVEKVNQTIEDISEYLTNSAKIKELSLPKKGSQAQSDPIVSYDFDGYVFRVLTSPSAKGKIGNSNILSDDLYTDVINATAYTRNAIVAEELNIEIREFVADEAGFDLKKSLLSFDDTYDLLSLKTNSEMYMQLQAGNLVDLRTIKTLNLDKPWYDSSSIRDLAIADKLFVLTGDIIAGNNDAVSAMVFNQDLAKQFGYYTDDTYTFIEYVTSGRWTLDNLLAITENINSSIESGDATYGAFYTRGLDSFALSVGAGAGSFYSDATGIPKINLTSESFKKIFTKVYSIQTAPLGNSEIDANGFMQGRTLFDTIELGDLRLLKETGINYCVLPLPKYDESQKEYRSSVNLTDAVSVAVPINQQDLNRTGIIIERLSSESSRYMWESYYDSITDSSADSQRMIKIILSNKVYDLGDLLGWINVSQALDDIIHSNDMSDFSDKLSDRSNAAQFVMNIILKNIEKNK
ncbi:MAG: hypothetical protein GX303_04600 [Clostridiales bacterium]|nr:hypothetical protein [Clostridiales bacterium]